MKVCKACFLEKKEFPIILNKEKSICKECYISAYGSIEDAIKRRKETEKRKEKRIIERNQQRIVLYMKTKGCIVCKEKNYLCLEFRTENGEIKKIQTDTTAKALENTINSLDLTLVCYNCFSVKNNI